MVSRWEVTRRAAKGSGAWRRHVGDWVSNWRRSGLWLNPSVAVWLAVGLFSCLVTFDGRAGLAWRALDSMGVH